MCSGLDAGKKYPCGGAGLEALQQGQRVEEICLICGVKEALGSYNMSGWLRVFVSPGLPPQQWSLLP